ncbi:uncharacterized protein LOC120630502 [Pararge aegeria]|uniref:Jg25862 protein n=1 Tax=Pararge aegeria aegeria TaxID=348720 RepID=A0A8S4RRS8_9NEOP|nr:uncharacterized protein LOC120630502 [Pararge aegeria]CAH2240318.1 jg25862 [Pararge aegeria aegeria]
MFKLVVLSVALAVASANPSGIWGGLATPWNAAIAAPLGLGLAAPLAAAPLAAVAPVGAYNYRGPLSLAPGQPANILAADGRPLDTLSVNLDRAVHLNAKAVEGHGHWLKKRSVVGAPLIAAPWAAPVVALTHSSRIDIPAARLIAPVGIAAAPIAPLGLGVHGASLGHLW